MNKKNLLSDDTMKKLQTLLGSFNGINSNIDMYSLCIKKRLKEKLKTSWEFSMFLLSS